MNESLKIKNVYVFGNGMVMVFDQFGQQMPEYQGRDEDVRAKIRAVYSGPIVATDWRPNECEGFQGLTD